MARAFSILRRYTAMHTTTNEQQGERGEPMKVLALITPSALLVTPLTVAAPPPGTVHRIGFLWNASPVLTHHLLEAFRHGLHVAAMWKARIGYREPLCRGRPRAPPRPHAELVGLQWPSSSPRVHRPSRRSLAATSTISVVIAASSDPVETGFVTSLARPART